jgi:periplasmic protein TonB
MSYLHLQKNWPIALSIVAHIIVLSWINIASVLPTQPSTPIKTITVTLLEPHPREITQLTQSPVTTPPAKTVLAKRVTPTTESVIPTTVPIHTQTAQVTEQAIEPVTETRTEQVTKIPPAKTIEEYTPTKTIEEYTPPSLSAEYLHNPEPTYPLMAKRRGEQGHVLLQVTVSETGQAVVVVVLQSSGYALLDQSAVRAVKNWQFVPATANRQAVTAQVKVPVRFILES